MLVLRSKATASEAREVAIRAGEEKHFPLIDNSQSKGEESEYPETVSGHQPNQGVDGLEHGSIERPEQQSSQPTNPRSNGPTSGSIASIQKAANNYSNPGMKDVIDKQEPLSRSAPRSKSAPRTDNHDISDGPNNSFGKVKSSLKQSQSKSGSNELTIKENPMTLREENEFLRVQIRLRDKENARYLDAVNENRETMQMQSDKIRAKELRIQNLQRQIQADQQKRLQSSTRMREQETKHQKQERSIRDLQAQLDQLSKNLSDSYQRTEQLERAWKESTEEVAKLRQQSSVHKVDDSTLKAAYGEIIYSVGNWASNYCGGRDATFHEADLLPLESLTCHYRQYVSSEVLRPVLIQSLVMRILVENILYSDSEPNGLLWAGCLSPGLRLVQKALEFGDGYATQELLVKGRIRPSQVQEYSAWKAKTAILVAEAATELDVDLLITDMKDRFQEILNPFVTCRKSEVWTDLHEIIQTTVRLDREIHMSRALFTFDKWSGPEEGGLGFEYNEETSASAQGFEPAKNGMKVELVVAPFFMKTGTGDGDAYETSSYLSKCVVVCTESRRKLENF